MKFAALRTGKPGFDVGRSGQKDLKRALTSATR
jgi:hypothetical protein